jgi:hypothetical protein
MGNTWDVTLWVPCDDFSAPARHLLDVARSVGYVPLDAARPAAVLTDQLIEVGVDTLEDLVETVAREGGSLPLWREREGERDDEHDDLLASFRPDRHRLSLGCLHDLRADRPKDHAKAADLTRAFHLAAASPLVAYGHFSDEHLLEALWQGQDFGDAHRALWATITARQPPPILFWQTYFRADFFANLPASALATLPHRAEPTPHGTFLSLADFPWNATLAVLDSSTGTYHLTR